MDRVIICCQRVEGDTSCSGAKRWACAEAAQQVIAVRA